MEFIRKRLQVFVSSTYSDLIDDRQAAVEAILTAGHIPAGMELFTAGDESQMDVIGMTSRMSTSLFLVDVMAVSNREQARATRNLSMSMQSKRRCPFLPV